MIPELLRASAAEMESELFTESMLVPAAIALVPETRTVSERVLGFKVWDFVCQYSQSAVANHGIYFGPLMFNFCHKYHEMGLFTPYKPKPSPEEIVDLDKIFDQILSCIETHALSERLDSFMNTASPLEKFSETLIVTI